jgi:excinuclease ABC subunit C
VAGIDDFRSLHEVVSRRYRRLSDEDEVFPDLLLIDGGKGQLNAALQAFRDQDITPPAILSLAKREEEIYLPDADEPIRLSKNNFALRFCCNTCGTKPTGLPSTITINCDARVSWGSRRVIG